VVFGVEKKWKGTLMKSKYSIGSKIHQALCKLETAGMDAGTLRKSIEFKESSSIFDRVIIQPLVNDGMVSRQDINFYITPVGVTRLDSMGRFIKSRLRIKEKLIWVPYVYQETPSVRVNADDHFKFGSRRGNKIYYRDGRVEDVTHN
jgi:hypothetical protein